ncbi:glutamate-5-semialdehyde dehydrogenase [Salinicoccus hispanicus]|uniref:Gamma-glutamyl phosphate reductase n=1 Tax=Salinicoccus hispanicus TaxID=157225 RepID=A0A6N8U2Y9_9STAP|nr:glutamate-5-semialdehyde dehydrogenase [Salinicoccus hispanicus]MXQ52123.1 glutamate-5-semialdehyde dehydrogenase [Salinicoccus hispanicus]
MAHASVDTDMTLEQMGIAAKSSAKVLRKLSTAEKNDALEKMAEALEAQQDFILNENMKDLMHSKEAEYPEAMVERLTLNQERIQGMANGLRQIAGLPDPTAVSKGEWVNGDGLRITRRSVPLGVIGIIYESRPNVTVDATALCLKAGNSVILRGGKEAINSNKALIQALKSGLEGSSVPADSIQLITDPSRELAAKFMKFNAGLDCLIPRGGGSLIQTVLDNATVPVIETGTGNCHLYIHEQADLAMAKSILINGKTQRPSVCNALETLLIDESIADTALPILSEALAEKGVLIHGDETVCARLKDAVPATEADYHAEYLANEIAVKIVADYETAVSHIEKYSSGHSDAIVTTSYTHAQDFLDDIDSAAVYVNASTRFTDGEMFGFGGEIGISTQKLHARGPMGLEALTSYKYVILGSGQIKA